jgi:tetratricopeptide (TPR) repeat protein
MAPFMLRFPTPRARDRRVTLQEEHPLFTGMSQGDQQVADQAPLEQHWCSLWMGRMMHFKAIYEPEGKIDSAPQHYLAVMVSDAELETVIDKFVQETRLQDENLIQQFRGNMREILPLTKHNATYWLGLIAQDRGKYAPAVDHLKRAVDRELDGPFRYGAAYNLARVHEEQAAQAKDPQQARKLRQQAIKLLAEDESPQSLGNRLRAKSLEEKE